MGAPPSVVYDAFIAPTAKITRRVEIYEKDGVTPWRRDHWNRLINGSVTVDQSRDDRRNCEFALDNWDGVFDHSPHGLWYDKVYKFFYGVDVNEETRELTVVIVEDYGLPGEALNLKQRLADAGYYRVRINTAATLYSEVNKYDVIVSLSSDYPRKMALLNAAYAAGKCVLSVSPSATASQLPSMIATNGSAITSGTPMVKPNSSAPHDANSGWNQFGIAGLSYTPVASVAAGAGVPARVSASDASVITLIGQSGNRWAHFVNSKFGNTGRNDDVNFTQFMGVLFKFLDTFVPIKYWECQIGEFLADVLSDEDDDLMQVSCRDYVKKCIDSKLVAATMFTLGTPIESIIRTLALNSGISKFNLPVTGKTLTKDSTWEADTPRWKPMKEISESFGFELFFDATGTLTMREFKDPLLTPPELILSVGSDGNLVKQGKRASDTSLKNHVVVAGESNDSTIPPVYAEAMNTMVGSSSSIDAIGDRVIRYTSSLVTTQFQAQELANQYIRVASLEEFELNFTSVMFPWLEVGDIIENTYLKRATEAYTPARYLLSNFTLPLDLGSMTGNAKRVTIVL